MKRLILPLLALTVTASMQASNPTGGKVAFKQVARYPGIPSLSGLGTLKVMPVPNTTSQGLVPFKKSNYDPRTIKDISYAADQQHPIFVNTSKVVTLGDHKTNKDLEALTLSILNEYQPILGVRNPKQEFTIKNYVTDDLGQTHVRMTQTYMGKEVYGKDLIVHYTPAGISINGRWATTPVLGNLSGAISAGAATSMAITDLKTKMKIKEFGAFEQQLLKYTGPSANLIVYPKDAQNSKDRWAYQVLVRPNLIHYFEYIIDAQTGEIVSKADISCDAGATTSTITDLNGASQSLHTYQHTNNAYYMIDVSQTMFNSGGSTMPDDPKGAIWTVDAQNSGTSSLQIAHVATNNNSNWGSSSATAASAHSNGNTAYQYYKNTHSRNSIDGVGGTIIGVINVAEDNGSGLDNAFWNGQLMIYGNGATAFKPLAKGLDVAGHEMTHGVVGSSANLKYQGQSGALNESMADCFGAMIDRNNWTIGEQVTQPGVFPSGSLRDLSDPHNGSSQGNRGWQPAKMSEFVNTSSDNGGVHTNSGITNKGFFLFATATSKSTAERVYYRALTMYMTQTSQFLDERLAAVRAAGDLFGATSAEVTAAKSAFDQVEIFDGTPTTTTTPNPVSGSSLIITQNTDSNDPNALYLVDPLASTVTFTPMNRTFGRNNVSVTDDGSIAYFVGNDNNIYSILTTSPFTQTQITTSGDWDNVSVSRDGTKLALVSNVIDTAIYIYSAALNQTRKYHLYNPTTAQGVTTNGPVYADALDWDLSGEYVIYDEKNVINNTGSTTDIEYWDIGLIKAWDKAANTWGSGDISKLVNDLPDGYSIGNPIFSKNHADIVAFDLSAPGVTTYDTKGVNLSTGDIGSIIVNNDVPGVPSFNGTDDKITFTYTNGTNSLIGIEPLATDRINGNGSIIPLGTDAAYSVWFTRGRRTDINETGISDNVKVYPVPTSGKLSIDLQDAKGYSQIEVFDMTGRLVKAESISGSSATIDLSSIESGIYILKVSDAQGGKQISTRIVKQ